MGRGKQGTGLGRTVQAGDRATSQYELLDDVRSWHFSADPAPAGEVSCRR